MAKRGPKPKPTPLKLLKGERSDRVNQDAPVAEAETPDCPDHLDDVARSEWSRMAPILVGMGVLAKVDGTILALYCQTYSRWVKAEKEIQAGQMVTQTARGGLQANPYIKIARDSIAECKRLLTELGGTPSSRSSLKIDKEKPVDELEEFLGSSKSKRKA